MSKLPLTGRVRSFAYAAAILVHVLAVVVVWRDLARRPAEAVRGRKLVWRIAVALNAGNAIPYFIVGRRRDGAALTPPR